MLRLRQIDVLLLIVSINLTLLLSNPNTLLAYLPQTAIEETGSQVDDTNAEYQAVKAEWSKLNEAAIELTRKLASKTANPYTRSADQGKLKKFLKQERELLEKMSEISPDSGEASFQLAALDFREGNVTKGLAKMQEIAPLGSDADGKKSYFDAYIFLAQYYLQKQGNTETEKQQEQLLGLTRQYVSKALTMQSDNLKAMLLQAWLFERDKAYGPAYEIYKKLFDRDPAYYRKVYSLSRLVDGEGAKVDKMLDDAMDHFYKLVHEHNGDRIDTWTVSLNELVAISKLKADLASSRKVEQWIIKELELANDNDGKAVYLKRQLAVVYSDRAIQIGRNASKNEKIKQLEILKQAFEVDSENERTKQWLTILGSDDEVSERAREIYDPQKDQETSWIVDSELAHSALVNEDFGQAIKLFERARSKSPANPQILNNLAYAYLKSDDPNPSLALLFVDQAIMRLRQIPSGENLKVITSSFYDTRGEALMQLGRSKQAATAYEIALRNRPGDKKILKNLIEIYSYTDPDQAAVHRRELEKLKNR